MILAWLPFVTVQLVDVALPPLTFDVSDLAFGTVPCNQDSAQKIQITNTGGAEIAVTSRYWTGSTCFTLTDDGSGKWGAAQGVSHQATVIFHPRFPRRVERGVAHFTVEYHDQAITAERNRIRGLIEPEIATANQKLAQLRKNGPDVDILDALKLKADVDHRKILNAVNLDVFSDRGKIGGMAVAKERELEEMRTGAFCSGCNRTRSDILSKGEQFPHPGQKIVAATQEQLAAKAREWDAKIAAVEQHLQSRQQDAQRADVDFADRIKELDGKRALVVADWEAECARIARDIRDWTDHLRRLMAKLDGLANLRKTATAKVEGSCNDQ